MKYLIEHLKAKNPRTLKICALASKPERREVEVPIDYLGFEIPNKYVVGFGFDIDNNYILEVLPRKNELTRPSICNIDQAVIIASLKQPDFDTNLLDKLLCIIEFNNIKPIIIFTKGDLLSKSEMVDFKKYYDYYKCYYDVYMNDELSKIKMIFKDKVSVFTGQSGAGKSTLLNNLDKSLNIKTGEISLALNRGRHTTRHTALLKVYGGLVADTPGFSALDIIEEPENIRFCFLEFKNESCKFNNCKHLSETGCAVKRQLEEGEILSSRYENYKKMVVK